MIRFINNYFLLWICWTNLVLICKPHPRVPANNKASNILNNTGPISKLLEMFGLERNSTDQRQQHPIPPQYMLDLYRTFSEGHTAQHQIRYQDANTVRSFFDKGKSHGNYYFDVDRTIFTYEEIIAAEFHFFCDKNAFANQPSSHLTQLLLYIGFRNSSRSLLESRLLGGNSPGWEVFKVTATVKKWLQNPSLNAGFEVEILDLSRKQWVIRRRYHMFHTFQRPILIVFSFDKRRAKSISSNNHKSIQNSLQNEPHLEKTFSNEISTRSTRSASVDHKGQCARHELRVDFEKLGWSSWIISPKWYDAYVCAGSCAFPLGQNQRPTNHATVQSIVHELGLIAGVKAPCCVPTELQSVSLLYFDEHTNVVLKQYEEMVAMGCGCQ